MRIGAGRHGANALGYQLMQMRDRTRDAVADHRARPAMGNVLPDRLAGFLLIAGGIADIIRNLIGLADLLAEAMPGFRVVAPRRSRTRNGRRSKQRAGLRAMIVREIDRRLALPGL